MQVNSNGVCQRELKPLLLGEISGTQHFSCSSRLPRSSPDSHFYTILGGRPSTQLFYYIPGGQVQRVTKERLLTRLSCRDGGSPCDIRPSRVRRFASGRREGSPQLIELLGGRLHCIAFQRSSFHYDVRPVHGPILCRFLSVLLFIKTDVLCL